MPSTLLLRGAATAASLTLLAGACAPPATRPPTGPAPVAAGLPPVPSVDGPLEIRVVHPTPSTTRPNVDSTLIYGSVGTGRATLTINGADVPVAPNGAFLGFVRVPADGVYHLRAQAGGRTATATRAYRSPAGVTAAAAPTPLVEFPAPRTGTVTGGADTLRTGSDVALGRATPSTSGALRWFLPRGARVAVTGQQGDMLRVRMDTATAWFPASALQVDAGAPPSVGASAAISLAPAAGWVDVRVDASGAPFHIQPEADRLVLTVYDRAAGSTPTGSDPLLASVGWRGSTSAQAEIRLARPLWGYKAFYAANGDLIVRIRRPPTVDSRRPLQGLRIVVDPGHPPAGSTGPTGLTEAEANLAIGLRLAALLRERGAEVLMTRTSGQPLVSATDPTAELRARTELAVNADAHLLVSVHNNAFPEGVNPFRANGTSTYYYYPASALLARYLNEEILGTTRIRDLGARVGNFAVVRPTWFPGALTESLFMPVPEHEAALRDPLFLDRLAEAHVVGLERFVRTAAAAR